MFTTAFRHGVGCRLHTSPRALGMHVRCQVAVAPMSTSAPAPPRSIWAVGKNYLDHIKELKDILNIDQDVPKEPIIFLKAGSTLLQGDEVIPTPLPIPEWSVDVQHEVELAVQLGPDLKPARAAVAIDLTARDVQAALKSKGYPWTLAKSFPASCPIGPFFDVNDTVNLHDLKLGLRVNSVVRQNANTSDMIFKVPSLLQYLKQRYPLEANDIILTGTPEGVGRLNLGDVVMAWVTDAEGTVLSRATWVCVSPTPNRL